MQIHFYMVFEHKCVLAVCVHIHPIMIKIHPVFFFFLIPNNNNNHFLRSGCSEIQVQVQVQVELYCHSATCGDIQWNEMSCLTGPRCYINTDIQQ